MAHDVVLMETLQQFETDNVERTTSKVEHIGDFPDHSLDRPKNHPGYRFRVGDFRALIDWDKHSEVLYAIDVFKRKKEYRELGRYRQVWVPGETTGGGNTA